MFGVASGVWRMVSGLLLVLLTLGTRGASAQIALRSDLVTVEVTVLDAEGNYVTDLQKEDFELWHDGIPQPIAFFEAQIRPELSRPLAVVFALDTSGSVGPQIAEQQHAARQFISLIHPGSVFAVIGFNDRIRIFQKFTSDPTRIERAFERAREVGGRTRLYDALDRAITLLSRDAPRRRDGRTVRRVIIVITDGFDYTSTISHTEVIHRANAADVTIYSITLPSYVLSVTGRRRVPTLLDASGIVRQTGGRDFSAEERDFTPIFRAIAEEIRASYTLAYYPPLEHRQDGRFHQITVTVRRPGLIVRQSRRGYLAPQG
jgi:VWFA-related protein